MLSLDVMVEILIGRPKKKTHHIQIKSKSSKTSDSYLLFIIIIYSGSGYPWHIWASPYLNWALTGQAKKPEKKFEQILKAQAREKFGLGGPVHLA
jgi:hypothetical protein